MFTLLSPYTQTHRTFFFFWMNYIFMNAAFLVLPVKSPMSLFTSIHKSSLLLNEFPVIPLVVYLENALACLFTRHPRHNNASLFSTWSLQLVRCLHRFCYRVVLPSLCIIQSRSCILTDILFSPHLCFLSQFLCTVVAILLHYFFMAAFAWMFVEALHIYRMQTEARNINYGAMRFYYAIGWGVPAIITGRYIHTYTMLKKSTYKTLF